MRVPAYLFLIHAMLFYYTHVPCFAFLSHFHLRVKGLERRCVWRCVLEWHIGGVNRGERDFVFLFGTHLVHFKSGSAAADGTHCRSQQAKAVFLISCNNLFSHFASFLVLISFIIWYCEGENEGDEGWLGVAFLWERTDVAGARFPTNLRISSELWGERGW
ncbi:hypothetical protein B0T25DRAFT_150024 [Lasiosphaeria hispida]|uniref:Uncharacterized protein n=1 Tax=Lasiosphaeria hispida TaxID=260671 RepID=A0AAJ0HLY1_9PEZI|nr:hypothetical protein B0T25DRAFT_150024 [Lasiosphaeria hispida]